MSAVTHTEFDTIAPFRLGGWLAADLWGRQFVPPRHGLVRYSAAPSTPERHLETRPVPLGD